MHYSALNPASASAILFLLAASSSSSREGKSTGETTDSVNYGTFSADKSGMFSASIKFLGFCSSSAILN
jgi:hypothetical protein